MTVEALAKGFKVVEIPIEYSSRKVASATKLDPLGDGFKIGRTAAFCFNERESDKVFLHNCDGVLYCRLVSCNLCFRGLGTSAEIASLPAVVLASLLFVTGAISFVVGLLAELVVRSRRRVEYLITRKLVNTSVIH